MGDDWMWPTKDYLYARVGTPFALQENMRSGGVQEKVTLKLLKEVSQKIKKWSLYSLQVESEVGVGLTAQRK